MGYTTIQLTSRSGYSGFNGGGLSGYSGVVGSGLSGYSGISGYSSAGSSGSGYSGFSGFKATSGASGYSGYDGGGGSAGFSGYSGYDTVSAGSSGLSGYSGHQSPVWYVVTKTADQTKTADTVFANDTELFFDMDANSVYNIMLCVFEDTTAAADFKYQLAGPATIATVRGDRRHVIPAATAFVTAPLTALPTNVTMVSTTGTNGGFILIYATVLLFSGRRIHLTLETPLSGQVVIYNIGN
jgi:hypothetical protein